MKKVILDKLLIALGWCFVLLAMVGAVLPLLPTTPFLIIALALFSNSSPRFHQLLLENRWFGPGLKQWDKTRTVSRETKKRASLLIILTFAISILMLSGRIGLQFMLVGLAFTLLFFIWRLQEKARVSLKVNDSGNTHKHDNSQPRK